MRFKNWIRLEGRKRRHCRIRNKIAGTADHPRICVYRSLNNLYAQIIDDDKGATLFSLSTKDSVVRGKVKSGGNVEAAKVLGATFAQSAKEKGFSKVVFDRSGYLYHGRVKAFVESARKNGLEF
ncbi:MAG: 50S ribosomal protein L18 [Candidatus Omnitrophota bacterium]